MAGADEDRDFKHTSCIQRDLVQNLISGNNFPTKLEKQMLAEENKDEEEEIELSLGLSLNGRFGVDPERAKKITRSSSVLSFMISTNSDKMDLKSQSLCPSNDAALMRTRSLPVEMEEELRKRKELQSLRRLEAKRKRMEKLKNARVVRGKFDDSFEIKCEENGNGEVLTPMKNGEGFELDVEKNLQHFSSQGSIGSQGSGSSGVSDLESQTIQGTKKSAEHRSPSRVQSAFEKKTSNHVRNVVDNTSSRAATAGKEVNGAAMALRDMPYVSTRGGRPHGKRIEGLLYRYKSGEEVRIVCVCHGSFLTPAEFVKHAGGGDVEHPLKHIVINQCPLL